MKYKINYGFPLSYILIRLFLIFSITFMILGLIVFDISLFIVIIISIIVYSSYLYFFIIRFKKQFVNNRQKLFKKFVELANLKGEEKILDLGTGSGFLAIGFAKNLTNGKSYGLDRYSLKSNSFFKEIKSIFKINFIGISVKNAKNNADFENVKEKCEFAEHDIRKPLNFSNEFFDVVVSCQFFYCIDFKDRENVYREINRVLKKNGKIIFFESKSFKDWEIFDIKKFFENIGYKISIVPSKDFKNCCILFGTK